MTKNIKTIITLGVILVAAIVIYLVLAIIFWKDAYILIKSLKWTTIAIFIAWILAISFIKASRFFIILRAGDVRVSFIKTLMVFIPSQVFTPLPGGEIGRAVLFKNKLHLTMEQIATPVYLQAIIELWTATFLAIVTIFFIKTDTGIWLAIGLFFMLAIFTVSILIPKRLYSAFSFLKSRGLKYKWIDKLIEILNSSEQFITKKNGIFRWKFWLSLIAMGLFSNIIAGGLIWYIATLQGVSISFFQSIFAAVIAILIQGVLGIIPGGLGVTEGGLIGILTSFAITFKKAVIITLLYRILTLPLLMMIALVFLFFIYMPNIFKNKK